MISIGDCYLRISSRSTEVPGRGERWAFLCRIGSDCGSRRLSGNHLPYFRLSVTFCSVCKLDLYGLSGYASAKGEQSWMDCGYYSGAIFRISCVSSEGRKHSTWMATQVDVDFRGRSFLTCGSYCGGSGSLDCCSQLRSRGE